jgi:hypothetical protein
MIRVSGAFTPQSTTQSKKILESLTEEKTLKKYDVDDEQTRNI